MFIQIITFPLVVFLAFCYFFYSNDIFGGINCLFTFSLISTAITDLILVGIRNGVEKYFGDQKFNFWTRKITVLKFLVFDHLEMLNKLLNTNMKAIGAIAGLVGFLGLASLSKTMFLIDYCENCYSNRTVVLKDLTVHIERPDGSKTPLGKDHVFSFNDENINLNLQDSGRYEGTIIVSKFKKDEKGKRSNRQHLDVKLTVGDGITVPVRFFLDFEERVAVSAPVTITLKDINQGFLDFMEYLEIQRSINDEGLTTRYYLPY